MNSHFTLPSLFAVLAFSIIIVSCSQGPPSGKPNYPVTKTVDVVDTLFGTPVPDPYRWLEDTDDPEVQKWTDAEDSLTRSYLDKIPVREKIVKRLEDLWNYPTQSLVTKCTGRYFIEKNAGLQNHDILYTMKTLADTPQVVINPNTWSEEGTVAMDYWVPSDDGAYIAYGKSSSGAEKGVLHIKDVVNDTDLPDTIPNCRYPSVAWLKDNSGFYYERFPQPGTVPPGDESYYDKIYFHKLGDHYTADKLIYSRDDIKELGYGCDLSTDDHYLILYDFLGSSRTNELRYIDLKKGGGPKEIVTGFNAFYSGRAIGDMLYLRTNEDAPNYRIIAVDLRRPQHRFWKEIVPEQDDMLESFEIINNMIIAKYLHNAYSKIEVYNLLGVPIHEIELPTLGTVRKFSGRWDDPEMYLSFTSYTYPTTHYRYHFDDNSLSEYYRYPVKVNTDGYTTRQVWYKSKDGTKVSMFIVHKDGIEMDGSNPTYLTGYGGFTSNATPYFSSSRFVWLENGGVFAEPNLRGGGEYGEQWHRAGMLENKQNTFDDFIAAAEYLINEGYTSPEKLSIDGGSNGGLTVGAVAVQRPELFKAVDCSVPLLDMLRFHKFLMARYWISEYGNPENPEDFEYIYKYSPYHHVETGVAYPAMLITASETDSRVHPMHARKFAAALQNATSSDAPILLYVDRKTGHGWGMATSTWIDKIADSYAFLFWQLGMDWKVKD
jgi:prolyl oligopeptidase